MMKTIVSRLLTACILFMLPFGSFRLLPSVAPGSWESKVDSWLLNQARVVENLNSPSSGNTDFIILLSDQADLSAEAALPTRLEKGQYVFRVLTETASRTQGPLLAELDRLGVDHQPFWVANMIWARGDLSVIRAMAQRPDVARLVGNPRVQLKEPAQDNPKDLPHSMNGVEWNISRVNAPSLWAAGYTGQGVVVGGEDTGYQWDHPALKNQYRGWNGTTAQHAYNWHDAIHSGAIASCPSNSPVPCDDFGHGTHTMGTMVGDDGAGNQVGMAPGAKWIGCRNMNRGTGTPATYSECFQWFIAPTDLNNANPDPSKAPDVINNSWGCPPSEGCSASTLLQVVSNTRAAGIEVVASAGNEGGGCETVTDPPGIYQQSFSAGATDSNDNIAYFSSRGAATIDGSSWLKPDISAPGVGVRSSIPTDQYGFMSGTSMAAPHVAGLVALLISAEPALRGQPDQIEALIAHSALPRTSTQTCNGVSGSSIPNNTYGWGRIDALSAYQRLPPTSLEVSAFTSSASILPGELLTYTLQVRNPHPFASTHQVVLTDRIPLETTLITATLPYTLSGDILRWEMPALAPLAYWTVNLVVQASPAPVSREIINDGYAATSEEVPVPVKGTAIRTFLGYLFFFPQVYIR